jgi:sugar/nucleoside kinase (ribokinase family)
MECLKSFSMTHDYDMLLFARYFCDLIFTGLPELPRLGADIFGTGFDMVPGAGFNTALACQRLGLRAAWSCDFGDDFFSQFVLDTARHAGLDSSLFRIHPFPLRQVSVSFSFPHDRGFISYVDQHNRPAPAPLVERHRPRAVLLSSLSYGEEHTALVAAARTVGALIYMDCQSQRVTLATPGVAEAIQSVDIFAPNEAEAIELTGAPTVVAALAVLADLAPLVVIKRGAAGALAQSGAQVMSVPAIPVEVFDTTGAGDCFNTGFLYGYLRGATLETCLRYGNICGGLSTTGRGSAGLPTAAQAEQWMAWYA